MIGHINELAIANVGVIEDARLEPTEGLVVITGETGAGKTLLLGAIELLMGLPARSGLISTGRSEATVEGRFVIGEDEFTVTRRLSREGRSRAYLDGAMVPAKALGERVGPVIEVVAQGEHFALRSTAALRDLIDASLGSEGISARESYTAAWARLAELKRDQVRIGGDLRALERERSLVEYQVKEISESGFEAGDDERLAVEAQRLRHASELVAYFVAVRESLERAAESTGEALTAVQRAARLDPDVSELADEIRDLAAGIAEASTSARVELERTELDPAALEVVELRLAELSGLRRKYGEDLSSVLDFGAEATARLEELSGLISRSEILDDEIAEASQVLERAAVELREHRRRAAENVEARAVDHLRHLGFDTPRIDLAVSPIAPSANGADKIELRFASDERIEPGPVGRVASGGELSRLVLALRLATGAGEAPVVVFDEVDAGLGGRTALAMGEKLASLAGGRQVLCVTHLPQVAAFADAHFVVERDGASATVRKVEGADQVAELARMLAGLSESSRGQEHAEELREMALSVRRGAQPRD